MATILTDSQHYTAIANAIRSKNGSSDTYLPSEMGAAITAIPTGGGGSTLGTKTITANGTYNASSDNLDGYSSVTVNVKAGAIFTDSDGYVCIPLKFPSCKSDGDIQMIKTDFYYSGTLYTNTDTYVSTPIVRLTSQQWEILSSYLADGYILCLWMFDKYTVNDVKKINVGWYPPGSTVTMSGMRPSVITPSGTWYCFYGNTSECDVDSSKSYMNDNGDLFTGPPSWNFSAAAPLTQNYTIDQGHVFRILTPNDL